MTMAETRLGTFISIAAPELIELAAVAGFDTVLLDAEHGALGAAELSRLVVAARSCSARSWIRVATAEAHLIGAALDMGANGVLVPQIGSAEQARAAVAAARFAPAGTRGANPWVRAPAGLAQRSGSPRPTTPRPCT
jgi:4-hydroxy-2-oxoheptanedioate aldolase